MHIFVSTHKASKHNRCYHSMFYLNLIEICTLKPNAHQSDVIRDLMNFPSAQPATRCNFSSVPAICMESCQITSCLSGRRRTQNLSTYVKELKKHVHSLMCNTLYKVFWQGVFCMNKGNGVNFFINKFCFISTQNRKTVYYSIHFQVYRDNIERRYLLYIQNEYS